MDDSILRTIRRMIGGMVIAEDSSEEHPFDMDLMIHINTILQILNQLGVGKEDFQIVSEDQTWSQFLGHDFKNLNSVKTYVYLRVKLLFDPPSSGTLMQAMKEQIAEIEWRLNTKVDRGVIKNEQHNQVQWHNQPNPRRHVLPKAPPHRPGRRTGETDERMPGSFRP